MNVEISGEIIEVVSSFKYYRSCFSHDVELQDMRVGVGGGRKTFGTLKLFNVRSVRLGVKRELRQRVFLATVAYGMVNWSRRMDERRKLEVLEMKCLQCVRSQPDG